MIDIFKGPRWAWGLLALSLAAAFLGLGHALIEVDDARYAEVPREMVERGDWATPTLNYLPYVEKPPLWYWLAAVSYETFGVSEAAARFPLAVLSCLGLLLTAWLGAWLFAPRDGLLGAAALGSAGLYFFLSHYITLDMGLTVTLLAETALILRCALKPQDARWAAPAAWLAAALAFLSKGLVALVLPTAWVVLLFWAFPLWRKGLLKLLNVWGFLIFCGVALPWYWLMEKRHPGFLHFIFIEQHFQRFLTDKYNRISPWYFFLLVLPAGLLPWTPAALASLCRHPKEWQKESTEAALALWVAVVLAFFSVSRSKLATYILPVLPHACLLAARALEKGLPRWARRLSIVLGGLFMVAAAGAPFVTKVPHEIFPWASLGVAALGAGMCAGAILRAAKARAVAFCMGGLLLGFCALQVMGALESQLSCKPLAQAVAAQARPEDDVWTYGIYLHGLPFYLRRPVNKMIYWIGELHYAKRDPANDARFGDDHAVMELPQSGKRTFVALRGQEARHFISLTPMGAISGHGLLGRWELAEFVTAEELQASTPEPRRRRR